MIKATINKILKSFDNLPKEYKNALYRILISLVDGIKALDELKVDKEDGKGLSSNDFTDELKNKLDGVEEGAQKNVKSDWNATEGDALILNKPTFVEYPNAAEWDSINHKIIFKHDDTELPDMEIDGADFIKDGMVENVEIVDGNLVITFNTDHGLEPISIPLSKIFNPENYYTKEDINHKFYTKEQSDNKYVEQVTGKQLSTEDFTTAFKEKLENIKDFTVLEFYIGSIYEISGIPNDIKEINDNSAKLLKTLVTNSSGDFTNYKQCLLIIHNRSAITTIPSTTTRNKLDFGNGDFIGVFTKNNYKIIDAGLTVSAEFAIKLISFNYLSGQTYYYGTNNFSAIGGHIIRFTDWTTNSPKFVYQDGVIFKDTFTFDSDSNLINLLALVGFKMLKNAFGQVTNYTNEQIEQLIAEGHQVKIFKLDITEDKTLLQQILTDNPEDGSIDITSVMYFIYDSTKQKYYDVNNITIETVESDRQINITAAIGRYDYTAIKINTNEAAYIINPSHVESANADWNENDEDKASYVKNRTHWIDNNDVIHHLDSKYLEDLTDEEINEILE